MVMLSGARWGRLVPDDGVSVLGNASLVAAAVESAGEVGWVGGNAGMLEDAILAGAVVVGSVGGVGWVCSGAVPLGEFGWVAGNAVVSGDATLAGAVVAVP